MVGAPKPHQGPMGSTSGPVPPQPTASATAPVVPKNFIQLPNGFNYNPYQIMGFQNKQTNEFALNVLKSQQFDPTQQSAGPPVAAVSGPIPGVAMAPSAAVVPQVLTATPPNLPPTATAVLPNWKIGDRCLAKYWEDGGVSFIFHAVKRSILCNLILSLHYSSTMPKLRQSLRVPSSYAS